MRNIIEKHIIEKNHIKEEEIKIYLIEILKGLQELHSMNLNHNDLKPENIFVNKDMEIKISDTGLSKFSKNEIINYMSPEQCRGNNLEKSTDIWALGCILYEMCTLEVKS